MSRRQIEVWLSRAVALFVVSLAGLMANWGWNMYQSSQPTGLDLPLEIVENAETVSRPFPVDDSTDSSLVQASQFEAPQRLPTNRSAGSRPIPRRDTRLWRSDEPFIEDTRIVPASFDVAPVNHLEPYDPEVDVASVPNPPLEESVASPERPDLPIIRPLNHRDAPKNAQRMAATPLPTVPLPVAPTLIPVADPAPPPQPTIMEGERHFTFNFQGAPWNLVLKKFSEEAGLSLQLTATPAGVFTYFDQRQYTLIEALDIFNDALLAEGFIAIRNDRSLTVLDAQSDIPERLIPYVTIDKLATLGRNELACITIPIPDGLVTAASTEWEATLSPLGKAKPLTSSKCILVTDVGSSLRRVNQLISLKVDDQLTQTFVYQLRNTKAEGVSLAINDFLSGQRRSSGQSGTHSTGMGASRISQASASSDTLHSQNPGLAVIAEMNTNSLLIRGTPAEVAEIQELIVQLDRTPPQVVIQALLVEVELGDTDEFGIELGAQDSVLFDRSVVDKLVTIASTTTAPNGVQTTNQNVLSQTSLPGFNFNNQSLGNNTAVHPSRVGTQGLSSLGVGRINGDLGFGGLVLSAGSESISVLLRALKQNYHVDILSRPQVTTLDNREALIQIGRQVPVVDGVSITAVGSANPVIRQDQSGIILKVTPLISQDDQVMIDVKAEKSAYQLTPGTGVPIFTDATNGNVIEAPVKDITTATTTVNVRSGQTIVLGGMITRDTTNLTRKVPFLGDVPYLGALFKYKYSDTKRKELLIFLTPTVIHGEADADRVKLEEMQRITMPYDVEQIHGPIISAVYATEEQEMLDQPTEVMAEESQAPPPEIPVIRPTPPSEPTSSPPAPLPQSPAQEPELDHAPPPPGDDKSPPLPRASTASRSSQQPLRVWKTSSAKQHEPTRNQTPSAPATPPPRNSKKPSFFPASTPKASRYR